MDTDKTNKQKKKKKTNVHIRLIMSQHKTKNNMKPIINTNVKFNNEKNAKTGSQEKGCDSSVAEVEGRRIRRQPTGCWMTPKPRR